MRPMLTAVVLVLLDVLFGSVVQDPILEEIWKFREEYAARFNYDIRAMVEDLRARQGKDGRKVVRLPPRPLEPRKELTVR